MRVAMRATGLAATALLLAPVTPSQAADGRLELSVDGRAWSANLRTQLFDPAIRWVPGDRRIERFWVRNSSPDTGRLVVTIEGRRTDGLIQTGDLTVTARGGGGAWMPVNAPGTHELLQLESLAPGDRVQVAIDVALARSARNQSQDEALDLALAVRLEQKIGSDDSPDLPNTGGPSRWWVLLGAGLVGAGAVVLAFVATPRPRRKRGAVDG
jgi:LPXTG-motif cell wall-anchored protein